MERAFEERKPGRERGRHHRVVEGCQNLLVRTFVLEEEHDFARREKDLPAIDELRDDRLDTVGEELRCVFAPAGLQASYENVRSVSLTSGSLGGRTSLFVTCSDPRWPSSRASEAYAL
jgi:hypothetical protein